MITQQYLTWLTDNPETLIHWRCIHDTDKAAPGHNFYGTLSQHHATLADYNNRGYGIFCNINAMVDTTNVAHIRAHVIDLDNPATAQAGYERAVAAGASFAVQSSPGKYHVYWRMQPYTDANNFFTTTQRKLNQLYDADKSIIDATRVMRVPGFMHRKGKPELVKAWPLANINKLWTWQEIRAQLQNVNIIEVIHNRYPLGDPDLAAPSLEWLELAMSLANPNDMSRGEWLSFSAAVKQCGWSLTTPDKLHDMWFKWCAQYDADDPGENTKLWNSIKDTEVGWKHLERVTPVQAYKTFGHTQPPAVTTTPPMPSTTKQPVKYGEILSADECQTYFKDCYFIEREGKIFSQSGRFMNQTQFNGRYGGKQFIITSTGKLTDEPWKAATRSTCWQVPKVDHIRFLPDQPSFKIIEDNLGRPGLNTYLPARIKSAECDISRWYDWLNRILPNKNDQKILTEYMAHCIKYPGYKIPWSILIQSAEGIGKTVFKEVLSNALGDMYVYCPKAPELVKSGSTFNAWMRGKLMILVDEIKIDERRELIEILKPMITDARVEIQSKGVDQEMEDNPANWIFFSNYKDAIPVNQNGRRYSIFYSALQSREDILRAGMDDAFFKDFWHWLRDCGGIEGVTHMFLNYPIQKGMIGNTAPDTSSQQEAIDISRSPLEVAISDAMIDQLPGFKGGYVSVIAAVKLAKATGIRQPGVRTVRNCLEQMGLIHLGRAVQPHFQEDVNTRSEIYGTHSALQLQQYGKVQGYE